MTRLVQIVIVRRIAAAVVGKGPREGRAVPRAADGGQQIHPGGVAVGVADGMLPVPDASDIAEGVLLNGRS